MSPTASSFRALRAAAKLPIYVPQAFKASPSPFQSIRLFSSSFQRFSTQKPPSSGQNLTPDPSANKGSRNAAYKPIFDSVGAAGAKPTANVRNPLYEPAVNQPPTPPREEVPSYEMTFTCKPCSTRSTHRISKQGYHHGSILITCPECRNRHIISDHLNIFGDKAVTIEDLMKERGEIVKKGTLSEDGDIEFWEDGTTTGRAKLAKTEKSKEATRVAEIEKGLQNA